MKELLDELKRGADRRRFLTRSVKAAGVVVSGDRELDVVVFGATGFAGRLVAGYLAGHAPGGVRIGLAGRSERRLAEVRAGLGAAASAWPLLVADSADPVSLAALARAARVVVTTVGPYRARGLGLVAGLRRGGHRLRGPDR